MPWNNLTHSRSLHLDQRPEIRSEFPDKTTTQEKILENSLKRVHVQDGWRFFQQTMWTSSDIRWWCVSYIDIIWSICASVTTVWSFHNRWILHDTESYMESWPICEWILDCRTTELDFCEHGSNWIKSAMNFTTLNPIPWKFISHKACHWQIRSGEFSVGAQGLNHVLFFRFVRTLQELTCVCLKIGFPIPSTGYRNFTHINLLFKGSIPHFQTHPNHVPYIYIYLEPPGLQNFSSKLKLKLFSSFHQILVVSRNYWWKGFVFENYCSKAFWEMHLPAPLPLSEASEHNP